MVSNDYVPLWLVHYMGPKSRMQFKNSKFLRQLQLSAIHYFIFHKFGDSDGTYDVVKSACTVHGCNS